MVTGVVMATIDRGSCHDSDQAHLRQRGATTIALESARRWVVR
jgi:hypothetical protein